MEIIVIVLVNQLTQIISNNVFKKKYKQDRYL